MKFTTVSNCDGCPHWGQPNGMTTRPCTHPEGRSEPTYGSEMPDWCPLEDLEAPRDEILRAVKALHDEVRRRDRGLLYGLLSPSDVIEDGDEVRSLDGGRWLPATLSVGDQCRERIVRRVQR